ncbi:MAG: prolyl oligopeptidase family serine peptidase [Brevefilum sp.]|nr:prolyl oligopeptidase family serine peptidase [Brevefilum sp.]MDT8380904.1 prolyl oligopeptidase family serine peptidase [Brevefilum sp.]MDW7754220.1 prolyl oligopeptidase family serine peptidase [Brevefilum sp.]
MPIKVPETKKLDFFEEIHGQKISDPYRWMEDLESEELRAWIEVENALTFDFLERFPLRKTIQDRMTELWNYEKMSPPFKRNTRYFYFFNDGLQNQDVLYWMEDLEGEPTVLIDPNTLSDDGTVALSGAAISRDGRYLAYGISDAGSDWQTWRVRRVDDRVDLEDTIEWVKFSGASWDKDDEGFYYSRYDAPEGDALKQANYFHKLYYHKMGTPQSEDQLIYERPDQKEWGFDGQVTEDGRYLIIYVWHGTASENAVFYLDLADPSAEVVELLPDFDAEYVLVGNDDTRFYFKTDKDAPQNRMILIDIANPNPGAWRELVPEDVDKLEYTDYVGGRFVCTYLHHAAHQVRIFKTDGMPDGELSLPGLGMVMGFSGRSDDTETFYKFSSFTTLGTVYHFDLGTRESRVFKAPDLSFDPQNYVTEQVFYESKDGTRVPLFISHHKDIEIDGETPTYLYGYGGFNIPLPLAFSVPNLVWMEMGGIFAQAHLRGGGEYGRDWHEGGMKHNKQNVFDDFIGAAEHLIDQGYTRTEKLVIGGRSNGGLLVGACLTQRPDLFGVCLPNVGVMDMLRFHKFTIGWAWVSDYGSPDAPEDFDYIRAYSPYHNIKPGMAYPPTMVMTGDHDDRVFPAHSFKFGAALQAAQGGEAPVLIRIETRAGHGAGKPTAKLIEEFSDMWTFALANLT